MASTSPTASRPASLWQELLALLRRPSEAFPDLLQRTESASLLVFPAVSGVYFAYAVASALDLGDRFPFAGVAVGVVLVGSLLGTIALWAAGTLPTWATPHRAGRPESLYMYAVFGYATWPFLPLLLVLVPAELLMYGTAVFDEARPDGPLAVVWLLRVLELATIGLWLVLMIKGTAVARRETEREAARDLARWTAEVILVGLLFLLMLAASVSFW